jgi:hypothetical protein
MAKKEYANEDQKEYPSLFNTFRPGQRVVRQYKKDSGEIEEYEGIIMAMDAYNMEIYWDTVDGDYDPFEIIDDFTLCDADEVYNGSQEYSPIKRKKKGIADYFDI